MEQLIGQSIGDVKARADRYRITALLGKQTGRRTFMAQDCETGRFVVIKLVLFGPDFTWEDLKLFEREAKTLQALNHPEIPEYLNSFEVKTPIGQGFTLVQTYIEAQSLQKWVEDGHTFSEKESKAIARSLLNILKYLHHRQPAIIHRDIKPSNILLTAQNGKATGTTYLIDFGSVQTICPNGTITVVGTYGYMPPEQFGGRAGPASDLYSVGATLIYLATGKHPAELTQSNLQIDFNDSHLSRPFSNWLRQLTYVDLHRRTPSAIRAIQQLAQLEKGPANRENHNIIGLDDSSSKILKSTFADLSIGTDPQKFVIQLSEARTNSRKYIHKRQPLSSQLIAESNSQNNPAASIAMGFMFFSFHPLANLLLKLGVEKPFHEPLAILLTFLIGAIIFAVSTMILWQQTTPKKTCRLTMNQKRSDTFLNIARIDSEKDTGWLQADSQHNASFLLSEVKLHSVSVTYGIFQDTLRFTVTGDSLKKSSKFDIHGNRQEIRWLCEHIRRWGQIELKDRRSKP